MQKTLFSAHVVVIQNVVVMNVMKKGADMYSPKIKSEQVRELYLLKKSYSKLGIKKPMTKIVHLAIQEYLPKAIQELQNLGGTFPDDLLE